MTCGDFSKINGHIACCKCAFQGSTRSCRLQQNKVNARSSHYGLKRLLTICTGQQHLVRETIAPKWKSLLNRVQGFHEHDDELFSSCLHGEIELREWLKKRSAIMKQQELGLIHSNFKIESIFVTPKRC